MRPAVKTTLVTIAAIIVGIVLSVVTDMILEGTGIAPTGAWTAGLLVAATLYRTIYTALGGFIVKYFANSRRAVIVIGIISVVANAVGIGICITHPGLGPLWYPVALTVLAYPATILGAKLA